MEQVKTRDDVEVREVSTATPETGPWWLCSVVSRPPAATSQSNTSPDGLNTPPAEARVLPSRANATAVTPAW